MAIRGNLVLLDRLPSLFQCEGNRGEVADLCRAEVLYCTWVGVTGLAGPLITMLSKVLERLTVKFHQGFLDNRLVLSMTYFHVHHHGDGDTTGLPFFGRCCKVGN